MPLLVSEMDSLSQVFPHFVGQAHTSALICQWQLWSSRQVSAQENQSLFANIRMFHQSSLNLKFWFISILGSTSLEDASVGCWAVNMPVCILDKRMMCFSLVSTDCLLWTLKRAQDNIWPIPQFFVLDDSLEKWLDKMALTYGLSISLETLLARLVQTRCIRYLAELCTASRYCQE